MLSDKKKEVFPPLLLNHWEKHGWHGECVLGDGEGVVSSAATPSHRGPTVITFAEVSFSPVRCLHFPVFTASFLPLLLRAPPLPVNSWQPRPQFIAVTTAMLKKIYMYKKIPAL